MLPFTSADSSFPLIATTLPGLEPVLAAELDGLGARDVRPGTQAVSFLGGLALLYRANYLLRTAHRVLVPLFRVENADYDKLYQACLEHAWEDYLDADGTFLIETVGGSNYMRNRNFATLRAKDGLVDRFMRRVGRRPSVGSGQADLVISVFLENDAASVSLDSSGRSLHRRGYRLEKTEAPLMETLAAGLLLAGGWRGQARLVDPMCGSGTIAIEAALLASNIPPGSLRPDFAFMRLPGFDRRLWEALKAEADGSTRGLPAGLIRALDIDPAALAVAGSNAHRAGAAGMISFDTADFFELNGAGPGAWLAFNPPYGERLKTESITRLYRGLGDALKKNWKGCRALVLSGSFEGTKALGLRPSRRTALWNGGIECRLLEFDIF